MRKAFDRPTASVPGEISISISIPAACNIPQLTLPPSLQDTVTVTVTDPRSPPTSSSVPSALRRDHR